MKPAVLRTIPDRLEKLSEELRSIAADVARALENDPKFPAVTCLRCTETWIPKRKAHPNVCANCLSKDWDKPGPHRQSRAEKHNAGTSPSEGTRAARNRAE